MKPLKVMAVFGTRPEAIKMAPVVQALHDCGDQILPLVAVTAQHREMLDQVLDLFQLRADYDLDLMKHQQSLEEVTSGVINGMSRIYSREKPDLVLVHGDTTTTMTAALAAFYQQIPVGHVEAGLRTGDKYSPFPEEMNRCLTGALADLHFAPTATARQSLLRENVEPGRVFVTGNTVIDALLATVKQEYAFSDPVLRGLDPAKRWLLVTAHRRENWGAPMRGIFEALRDLSRLYPDTVVVFPVHKNPRVRSLAAEVLGGEERVCLVEPMDYQPFVNLMSRSYLVLTDSGGLQEEAPSLGKPVLVLRNTTERPEAVAAGTVRLVGTEPETIMAEARRLMDDPAAYGQMANSVNPYGDGRAAERILQALLYSFGRISSPPSEYGLD